MRKQYGSFLLRCWRLPSGKYRVEVEHIQSGETVRLDSLDAASGWVAAQIHVADPPPAERKAASPRATRSEDSAG